MSFLSISKWKGLACGECGHDVCGNPDRIDQHSVGSLEGVDYLPGPEVLECDQHGRAVRREIVADLLGILVPQRTRLRDVDGEELRTLIVEVRSLERRHDALRILHDEEQIEHSDRAVLHEVQNRRGDPPGELVARKANDVDINGADCHGFSPLFTLELWP